MLPCSNTNLISIKIFILVKPCLKQTEIHMQKSCNCAFISL